MKLDVPTGTTFYWNPYSPKFYTIVQSPTMSPNCAPSNNNVQKLSHASRCDSNSSFCAFSSDDEGSFNHAASSSNNSSTHNYSFNASGLGASFRKPSAHHQQKQQQKQSPTDDVYNLGWSTISSIRQEKTTDAAICTMIQRFPYKTLTSMAAVIENSPNLFIELCEKERGNVVSHIVQALNGDRCEELVAMTIEHAYRLATHQSGCIALTRIMDGCNAAQINQISIALMNHFDELVCHQYGNFVLSRVAQSASDSSVMGYMCSAFESAEMLSICLNDKFGSHVFEAYAKNCAGPHLFRVCSVLFSDIDFVMSVATSKIANYPLQACLRQMMAHDTQHELSRWALATIPTLVQDTKFATNINRALGFGRTSAEQQQCNNVATHHNSNSHSMSRNNSGRRSVRAA